MIVIFRGVSGSWKSSSVMILEGKANSFWDTGENLQKDNEWAQYMFRLRQETKKLPHRGTFSADKHFIDENGDYRFNPKQLGEAHRLCMLGYLTAVRESNIETPELIIVDNTNCSIAEVAPYLQTGLAYGHQVKVVTLLREPRECAKDNEHEVPTRSIVNQANALDDSIRNWPPWWPQDILFTGR